MENNSKAEKNLDRLIKEAKSGKIVKGAVEAATEILLKKD